MNKFTLIGIFPILLCAGCTPDVELEESSSLRLEFDSFVQLNTKATGEKLESINSTMGVWGYKFTKGTTPSYYQYIPIFQSQTSETPQQVSFDKYSNSWVYAPLRYWDTTCDYHFYAVSPHTLKATCYFNEGKMWINDFTIESDIEKQVDILLAARKEVTSPEPVKFVFKHVLSKVNFKLQYGNSSSDNANDPITEKMEVTKLSLKNVFCKGTSGFLLTENKVTVYGWGYKESDGILYDSFSKTFDTPIPLTYKGEPQEGMMNLFLIPWSTTNVRLDVEYRIGKTSFVKKDISLPGSSWEPNVNYTYKIILDASKIELEYNVEKWTDLKIEIPPFS